MATFTSDADFKAFVDGFATYSGVSTYYAAWVGLQTVYLPPDYNMTWRMVNDPFGLAFPSVATASSWAPNEPNPWASPVRWRRHSPLPRVPYTQQGVRCGGGLHADACKGQGQLLQVG